MLRRLLLMTGILTTLFTAGIVAIEARPDDRRGLRELLLPSGECRSTCWLGMGLNETGLVELLTNLRENPLIHSVETLSPQIHRLHFSTKVPEIQETRLYLWVEDDHFDEVMLLEPDIEPGAVLILLGKPKQVVAYRSLSSSRIALFLLYPEYHVMAHISAGLCSMHWQSMWENTRIFSVSIGEWQNRYPFYPLYYDEQHIFEGNRWATELRALRNCG